MRMKTWKMFTPSDFTKNAQLHGRGTRTTPKLANTEAEEITKHFYTALNFHLSFHV